jgi:hypothetical protein
MLLARDTIREMFIGAKKLYEILKKFSKMCTFLLFLMKSYNIYCMKSLKLNVIGIFFALLLGVEIIFLFQLFGIFPQDLYGVIPEILNNFLLPIVIFLLTISGYSLVRMSYIQPVRQLRTEIAMFLA